MLNACTHLLRLWADNRMPVGKRWWRRKISEYGSDLFPTVTSMNTEVSHDNTLMTSTGLKPEGDLSDESTSYLFYLFIFLVLGSYNDVTPRQFFNVQVKFFLNLKDSLSSNGLNSFWQYFMVSMCLVLYAKELIGLFVIKSNDYWIIFICTHAYI